MSTLMISGPGGDEPEKTDNKKAQGNGCGAGEGAGAGHQQRHSNKPSIPSLEDCLRAFAQLAGLVAIGMIKPAQANAIRASYREILLHHKSKAKEAEKGLANADVLEMVRKAPELLDFLAPLLTPEQIEMLMRDTEDDADGQA